MVRKILKNDDKTKRYLQMLPKVYIIVQYAKWTVREFPFSGRFIYNDIGVPIPLVYDYDDHNGTTDHYYLRPLTHTTTGYIKDYTFNRSTAKLLVDYLNEENI